MLNDLGPRGAAQGLPGASAKNRENNPMQSNNAWNRSTRAALRPGTRRRMAPRRVPTL